MAHYLHDLRDRFHPLHGLRRFAPTRAMLRAIDVPVWTKMSGIDWKVRARLIRHANEIILPGGAEPSISALFTAIYREIEISSFWDVGSNVGYYAWLVKSMAPSCKVRLFEPDPGNIALIRATMRHTKLSETVLREVAVSDEDGVRCFVRDEVSGFTGGIRECGSTFSEREWGVSGRTINVQTLTVDQERKVTGKIDLIKIDVEGHEEMVIQGARATIDIDQPILIFECFHGAKQLEPILRQFGYRILGADRLEDPLATSINFLAMPKKYWATFTVLKKVWTEEVRRFASNKVGTSLLRSRIFPGYRRKV